MSLSRRFREAPGRNRLWAKTPPPGGARGSRWEAAILELAEAGEPRFVKILAEHVARGVIVSSARRPTWSPAMLPPDMPRGLTWAPDHMRACLARWIAAHARAAPGIFRDLGAPARPCITRRSTHASQGRIQPTARGRT